MYKYLLCWRYLRTRYIALASVISVMLGVATMIVVNSVMAGFADKMRDRLHGVLADVVVESFTLDGFYNSEEVMARVEQVAGEDIDRHGPDDGEPGILHFRVDGESMTRPVQLIGVRPEERAKTGDFAEFLFDDQEPSRSRRRSRCPRSSRSRPPAGQMLKELRGDPNDEFDQAIAGRSSSSRWTSRRPTHGAILGYALATYHRGKGHERHLHRPAGHEGRAALPQGRARRGRRRASTTFTVVGYFKSGMSEYDSTHVYVPLEQLAEAAAPADDSTAAARSTRSRSRSSRASTSTSWPSSSRLALDELQADVLPGLRPGSRSRGRSWARWPIEQSILNILLFFIIAVAGFGILAIFSMIVVEKTRDIGIIKALGASTAGIRGSSWATACCWGWSAAASGMVGGLLFVRYINEIEKCPEHGSPDRKVFDDTIYYFNKIPTHRRAVHGGLDRGRCAVDRGAGQHLAGPAGGAAAPGQGAAVSSDASRPGLQPMDRCSMPGSGSAIPTNAKEGDGR